jgi:hypothetical protein
MVSNGAPLWSLFAARDEGRHPLVQLRWTPHELARRQNAPPSRLQVLATDAVPSLFLYGGIVGIVTAMASAHEAREREIELVAARLDALSLQLQPLSS